MGGQIGSGDGDGAFERAKALFIEGVSHLEAGDALAAERCFEASLALLPERASTLLNLGTARLALGKTELALEAIERSLALDASLPDAWCQRGLALLRLRRLDEAVPSFDQALTLEAHYRPALFHLGCTLNEQRQHARALATFERLLALDAGNGAAWFRHGQTLQALDRHSPALQSYERALELDAAQPQAWINRGGILREAGRNEEAAAAYRQAQAHGGDAELIGFCLAAVEQGVAPQAPPRSHVQGLFDDYAEQFDAHLLHVLHYRGHEILVNELRQAAPGRRFGHALDLGCGTGLCGQRLRRIVARIDGVDVAANMLAQARKLGLYDQLVQADAASYMATTERRYDLVAAADVFTYVGALDTVFAGAARVLQRGGLFGFCAEVAEDDQSGHGFVLRGSLRYAHTRAYLEQMAAQHGFMVQRLTRQAFREDQRTMLDAWYGVLSR